MTISRDQLGLTEHTRRVQGKKLTNILNAFHLIKKNLITKPKKSSFTFSKLIEQQRGDMCIMGLLARQAVFMVIFSVYRNKPRNESIKIGRYIAGLFVQMHPAPVRCRWNI
jgi:hypothetical protein